MAANSGDVRRAELVKKLLEKIENSERFSGRVFEKEPYFFTVSGGELHIMPSDTGESVKGSWFPPLVAGPNKKQRIFIDNLMKEIGFDEDFFDDYMEEYMEFNEEWLQDYFEETEDKTSSRIYKKIKERVESDDSPFTNMEDFTNILGRYDLDGDRLYYKWEDDYIDLYENVCDVGDPRGVYEDWDDDDWIEILTDPEDYLVRLPGEEDRSGVREVEFTVTLCCGHGDGGDVCVKVDVTDEEYELMKQCCREDEEIDGYDGLEDLIERVEAEAKGEDSACSVGLQDDEDEDDYNMYDDISCMVWMPSEISDIVDSEYDDDEI